MLNISSVFLKNGFKMVPMPTRVNFVSSHKIKWEHALHIYFQRILNKTKQNRIFEPTVGHPRKTFCFLAIAIVQFDFFVRILLKVPPAPIQTILPLIWKVLHRVITMASFAEAALASEMESADLYLLLSWTRAIRGARSSSPCRWIQMQLSQTNW